ncbi:PREDICTED: uncharacterized protein LOC109242856 [Nicotiana attenuata]|uniref:uncharacterized protein LOC109242856 n=1 Tax=Nicotiana attenuata TaxID=49451 RepID=UPI00090468C2|nr:PREDICTED: uncharacterized protein LOC109242856 [Nicotiana attenuata]
MTRSSTKELISYDPEIERYLRLRRKEQTSSSQRATCEEMENQEAEDINPLGIPPPVQVEEQFDEVAPRPANRILRDYARPDRFNCESSVRKPPVAANSFEIRTVLIQTIQQSCIFTGDTSEDPHSHLIDFLELVETAKYNGVPPEAIKLRLFPFSLKGDAKTWLQSLPQGSITTWDQMTQKFLNKYFSPAKTTKLRQHISNFLQTDTESGYQAWERLKAMLRKCPHHDIPKHMQSYRLIPSARNVIDAAAGGSVMGKTTEEALQLLNEISENVNTQQSNQSEACDICGGNHQNHECQATNQMDEQVNVIGCKPYPFGSPMAQKHPGFQWSNPNGAENSQSFQQQQVQGPPGYQSQNRGQLGYRPYQQPGPYQQAGSYQQRPQQAHPSLDDLLYKYIKVTDEKMESQNSSLKNMEIQLIQLAALESEKIQGPLPSNTEKNPKEHLKVIALGSGKELDEPYADKQEKNQTKQQVDKGKNVEKPSEPSKEKEIKNKEKKF